MTGPRMNHCAGWLAESFKLRRLLSHAGRETCQGQDGEVQGYGGDASPIRRTARSSAIARSISVACFKAAAYKSVIQVSFTVAASRARISHIRPRAASRGTDWPLNSMAPNTA